MSKVLGIIAEYNPFHNGHLYHLQKAKEITNSDYTVAIISGNFTQRGSTSLIDKWSKTEMALLNGVDLVIELPVWYATSSAENFADGAIKILNSLGIVDYISFGTETPDINILNRYSDILYNEPEEYKKLLSNELKNGLSFPKAREKAIFEYLKESNINFNISSNVLASPNNILGIEYLKALKKHHSTIKPIPIARLDADYNSTFFSNNIASATAIRNLIKNNNFETIKNLVPNYSYSILKNNIDKEHIVTDLDVFEKEIIYILRRLSIEDIANLPDVSEGLEFAIKKAANSCNSVNDLLDNIKSKRYTITRLQRILLYSLLGISKENLKASKDVIPYLRVLGFNSNGSKLISKIHEVSPNVPIITQVKQYLDNSTNIVLRDMLYSDIFATNVYTLGFENESFSNLDFTHKIIKI